MKVHALALALTALTGCVDTEPYVPNGPHFLIEHSISPDGAVKQEIKVNLYTGDLSQYGTLTDGGMTLNGEPMKLGYDDNNLPSYFIESANVAANTVYNFEVRLQDGRAATATVTTQEELLTDLEVPASADHDADVPISWSPISNHDLMSVTVSYTSKANVETLILSRRLTPEEIAAGSLTLEQYSWNRSGVHTVRIGVQGFKIGTATNFADGGRIVSKMSVEKMMEVK